MMKSSVRISLIIALATAAAHSGEYHGGDDVICSDCHSTHFSERGTLPERAEPGGPYPDMLLIESADRLCLACHDGTDPTAPDVLAPVVMYEGSGSEFSGAGFFSAGEGITSVTGHDLGFASQVPYSNPARYAMLSCISCHDPHGTASYRNLILNPDSSGSSISVLLGNDIFENAHPQLPPSRAATIAAYRSNNIGHRANISEWCVDCHNGLLQPDLANPPAHFQRHPLMTSFEGPGYHVAAAHWVTGIGDGFGLATGDGAEGVPRLKFQAPNANDYVSSTIPGISNQIICSTCHFAHGGPYESGMTWPYNDRASFDLYSGCQQCHYK